MADEPLLTTTYTLTRADALAYERVGARPRLREVAIFVLWLGLWGAGALLLPAEWTGPRLAPGFALIVANLMAIGGALALLFVSLRQWLAARRRQRRPVEITLAEWPDRLALRGDGMPREIAFAALGPVLTTRGHLFLGHDDDVLILPRRAFPEEGSLEALARRIAETPPSAAPVPDEDEETAAAVDPAEASA